MLVRSSALRKCRDRKENFGVDANVMCPVTCGTVRLCFEWRKVLLGLCSSVTVENVFRASVILSSVYSIGS